MYSNHLARTVPSTSVTAAGVSHVRLSYHYLDAADIDAYGSLLDEDAQVSRPDALPGHGRAEVLRLHADMALRYSGHHIYQVVADGDTVAVTGVTGLCTAPPGDGCEQEVREVEFADFFTLTDEGMLLGYRRFYFAAPV
jgi:ketosteroid isomerase-like protein